MSYPLNIKRLAGRDQERWNNFVLEHPEGTFFHLAEWADIFQKVLRHNTYYLMAESSGSVDGVLPLVYMQSRVIGRALISTPFLVYGGVIAKTDRTAEALEREACSLAKDLNVDYLELRDRRPTGFPGILKTNYVTFRKEIPNDTDACLAAVPRKQRAMIRKGIANGLRTEVDSDISRFYTILSESYRNLGTPILSARYFAAINDTFPDNCEIRTVIHKRRAVASVMSFYFKETIFPYYGGGTGGARSLKAADFMYWDLMRQCPERRVSVFDYGRSRINTGSYRFKKHWGFEPSPLYYRCQLISDRPLVDVSPSNSRYRLASAAWKRLPVSITRVVGPRIARGIPG